MKYTYLLLFYICTILLCHIQVTFSSANIDRIPKSPLTNKKNIIIGSAALSIAALAKVTVINGPYFKEAPDMTGQTTVITGANTGLGLETAIKVASFNSNVYILCRNQEKGNEAVAQIRARSKCNPNTVIENIVCDLSDLQSVKKCSDVLSSKVKQVDVLINNAGVMAIPERQETKDGFEMHMGINHLGHFALTSHLASLLNKSPSARIVNVASQAYLFSSDTIRTDWMFQNTQYAPWNAYGNSKLANILFTKELARRLKDKSNILTYSLHPGACRTELGRYIVDPSTIPKALLPLVGVAALPLMYLTKSSEEGAQTQIYLSASRDKKLLSQSGSFFDNSQETKLMGNLANDDVLAKQIWDESTRLTGTSPKF